jgi:hypothetical protein
MTNTNTDPRLNLARGTVVTWGNGKIGRVARRDLNPNRRPGIGRVIYSIEPALVGRDGSRSFGMFRAVSVAAAKLSVLAGPILCECTHPGCHCDVTPPAVYTVERDGVTLNVCGGCDLPSDLYTRPVGTPIQHVPRDAREVATA